MIPSRRLNMYEVPGPWESSTRAGSALMHDVDVAHVERWTPRRGLPLGRISLHEAWRIEDAAELAAELELLDDEDEDGAPA